MTKQQIKALEIAKGHLKVNNPAAFVRSVAALVRSATNEKQANAIQVAAYDIQFGGE